MKRRNIKKDTKFKILPPKYYLRCKSCYHFWQSQQKDYLCPKCASPYVVVEGDVTD